MFSNPTAKFKTAKSSLQTAEVPLFFKTTSKTVVVYIHYQLNIWCTKQSELENKISSNKMKSSLSQPSFRNLFSQKITSTERKEFKKWCLHLNTKVEMPSKSSPTLRKDLRFSAILILFMIKCSQRKTTKMGKGQEKPVHSASKTKTRNLGKKFLCEALFSSSWEQSYSKTALFWRFRFYIPNIVRV